MTAIPIQSSARWRRDGQLLRGAKSMGTEHLAELSTKLSGCGAQSPTLQHSMVVLCDTSSTSVKLSNTPLLQIPGSLGRPTSLWQAARLVCERPGAKGTISAGVFPHQSFADDGCAAPSTRGSVVVSISNNVNQKSGVARISRRAPAPVSASGRRPRRRTDRPNRADHDGDAGFGGHDALGFDVGCRHPLRGCLRRRRGRRYALGDPPRSCRQVERRQACLRVGQVAPVATGTCQGLTNR